MKIFCNSWPLRLNFSWSVWIVLCLLNILIHNIVQESNLKQVIDHEREIHQDIQSLHSDMQTLVYENYNKFILATDTIGKVRC